MNKDKILEIAQGMPCLFNHIESYAAWHWDEVVQFANEIAKLEREECAKICDELMTRNGSDYAQAIRSKA